MENIVDARKEKIDQGAAWDMFQKFETIVVGKGKKYSSYKPDMENKEEIMKNAMGRSGSLRAPSLDLGKELVVGYNTDMYEEYIRK